MAKLVVVASLILAVVAVPVAMAQGTPPALPEGLQGIRGLMRGKLVSKTENSLVLKVEAVVRTWKENKATNAEAAVGRELTIVIAAGRERLINALKELRAGDTIVVGVMNVEGNQLTAVEDLRKAEAVAPTPAPAADEVARLKARVAELEKLVAQLRAENERLRKELAAAGTRE